MLFKKLMATPEHIDTAIIGCGAAGLMAAIHCDGHGKKVVAFDGAQKLGAKILVAGGGRCNVTHFEVSPNDYFGSPARSIDRVLKTWPVNDTVKWFADHGVKLKREDTGKLFPTTDKARTVLDELLNAVRQAGVELRHPCRVTDLNPLPPWGRGPEGAEGVDMASDGDRALQPRFQLQTDRGPVTAHTVILATGGKALPKSGSDGIGYRFAKALGHTVTQTQPALVPLLVQDGYFLKELSGLSVEAELVVSDSRKKKLYAFTGPVLFTHFGLSGPSAMNVSRHLTATPGTAAPGSALSINLAQQTFDTCDQALQQHAKQSSKSTLQQVLAKAFGFPQRLAQALPEHLKLDPALVMANLKKDDRRKLAHALTGLPIPVTGDRGYTHAEVTAGGVPLTEINLATMASKKTPGLYLCGEILNVDGRIGGFNFQWAWCTGRLAGQAINKKK